MGLGSGETSTATSNIGTTHGLISSVQQVMEVKMHAFWVDLLLSGAFIVGGGYSGLLSTTVTKVTSNGTVEWSKFFGPYYTVLTESNNCIVTSDAYYAIFQGQT
jgi:hypothetical protein